MCKKSLAILAYFGKTQTIAAAILYNMQNDTKPNDFVARQSVIANGLLTGFFGLIILGLLVTCFFDERNSFYVYLKPLAAGVCAFLISFKNTLSKREVVRINVNGFYYNKTLITTWDNFYYVYGADDSSSSSTNDDIRLVIQYYGVNGALREQRLSTPETLDRSVDEIIEAVNVYVH